MGIAGFERALQPIHIRNDTSRTPVSPGAGLLRFGAGSIIRQLDNLGGVTKLQDRDIVSATDEKRQLRFFGNRNSRTGGHRIENQ